MLESAFTTANHRAYSDHKTMGKDKDISQLRREYTHGGLRRKDLADDPFEQFGEWFELAQHSDIRDPSAMTVATVDATGQPSARTVLLKQLDARGFIFYTNFESRKGHAIESNNRVALLFAWLPLDRQIKIEGIASRVSDAEASDYFQSRPKESQWAAWASAQSRPLDSRTTLEQQYEDVSQQYSDKPIPLPPFWGGYCVKPQRIEFWQGRENRLHDRFIYTLQDDSHWHIERLAP